MNEIKVEPYIPDEDYDNPAMVVDFYEFTMANCLFLHGFKDTTLVFDMFFRKNPDNQGYSISAGQRKLTRFLLDYHFNEQDILLVEVIVQQKAGQLALACADGIALIVRVLAEEHIKHQRGILKTMQEQAVCHGEFVKVHHHRGVIVVLVRDIRLDLDLVHERFPLYLCPARGSSPLRRLPLARQGDSLPCQDRAFLP